MCDHSYRHIETTKFDYIIYDNGQRTGHEWFKTDRFFCEKCLEIEEKTKHSVSETRPIWY